MSAPARLLALKLQGFKSFAERTSIEFDSGISAVVGPNGSGKSNLADALRWALGEQGRALRSRKSEDVIWAGSERRAALGMADVTLVVDNADGLIPVEYQVLELGRRLYRSGENEYLLNRQRIRLRDLVDLLDGAHLADNAFLFIGQGMVDQALALRPEERRPLFEEVAGVRRHERRRRKAEEQLAESEANLARVEDILGELRPQVRRLAAQAEQQTTRRSAGEELADALVVHAHARWHEAAARLATASAEQTRATAAVDEALAVQAGAEDATRAIAERLETRSVRERELAAAHETARGRLVELQLRDARLAAEETALERDRARLADERRTAEAERDAGSRALAAAEPVRDRDLEAALSEVERTLDDALAQHAALQAGDRTRGDDATTVRRAEAARAAELETARRQLADAERRLAEQERALAAIVERRAAAEGRLGEARERAATGAAAETDAAAARDAARAELERLEGERRARAERVATTTQDLAGQRGRLSALERRIAAEAERGIAPAARRRGGRLVHADLLVDASLRAAVEAALADTRRAYVVGRRAVVDLAAEHGALVVEELLSGEPPAPDAAERRCRDRIVALGGGFLADAVRRDASGAVRRLVHRAAWLPDLDACLEAQPDLAPGWIVVARDGSAVVSALTVSLGRPEGALDWQAEAARLRADIAAADEAAGAMRSELEGIESRAASARAALERATADERAAGVARREAEEAERRAARDLEAIVRDVGWHEAQVDRLGGEVERLRAAVPDDPAAGGPTDVDSTAAGDATESADRSALASWESRIAELRARRDDVRARVAEQEQALRAALDRRSRAEAAVATADERIARVDRDLEVLVERVAATSAERHELRREATDAAPREEQARTELELLRAEDRADRERLATAEEAAGAARERLRVAEDRSRAADRLDLEARLALDALREQVLVELAGLGPLGVGMLAGVTGLDLEGSRRGSPASPAPSPEEPTAGDGADERDPDVAALEHALDAAAALWASAPPAADPPAPGRLAGLRRRYHELGAVNPYAVEEFDALRTRLQGLEEQESDLRGAIDRTRELIGELNALIATQFRTTFASLEDAFDRRFQQLFGGGFARLSLTDPDDLTTTGVEIVARPPGKKAQALAMLSGGERALTAVALLFAMLTVRPVPFCVLDEVDAALDEANVGRFSEALRELAAHTQFIVITHNRGTIESADALYGITVGDDSVSRVVSLRLEEAQAIAARSTNGSGSESLDPERVAG